MSELFFVMCTSSELLRKVSVSELRLSGLLDAETAEFVAKHIDSTLRQGFREEAFLAAMCEAHGYRPPESFWCLEATT